MNALATSFATALVAGVLLSTACVDVSGFASGGASSTTDGGGDAAITDGSTGDRIVPATDATDATTVVPLAPKVIRCATTSETCDGNQMAECCLVVTGTDTPSVRELGTLVTKCEATNAPNCGSYVSVGPDFTMKLPQRCARAVDCDTGAVCCAVAEDPSMRLSTHIAEISCKTSQQCAMAGRTLCETSQDCPATLNCLNETDPVLSKIYPKYCR